MDGDTRQLLQRGAEVATLLGLAVGIWSIPVSWAIRVLLLALLVVGAVLGLAVKRGRDRSRSLAEALGEIDELRAQLMDFDGVNDFADGLVALLAYVTEAPTHDEVHHFALVRESYFIDGDDATYQYELHGERVIEGTTDELVLKVTGDSPVDADRLQASAVDVETSAGLVIRFARDEAYLKVLAVILPTPVERGDRFAVKLTFRWENTFPRSRSADYLFSAWGYWAAQRVDRVEGRLSSDVRMARPVLEEVQDGKRLRSRTQPKLTHAQGKDGSEVTWQLEDPSTIHILRFEKDA